MRIYGAHKLHKTVKGVPSTIAVKNLYQDKMKWDCLEQEEPSRRHRAKGLGFDSGTGIVGYGKERLSRAPLWQ